MLSGGGAGDEVFKVHHDPVVSIDEKALLDEMPPHECSVGGDKAAIVEKYGETEFMSFLCPLQSSFLVHKDAVAIKNVRAGIVYCEPSDSVEGARQVVFVGVEPAHQVTRCHPETLVESVRHSCIGFGDPAKVRVGTQD